MTKVCERSSEKGFSLVELLLVLSLIAVLAGLAIPNFQSLFQKTNVSSAARVVADTMRYAQSCSITQSQLIQMRVNSSPFSIQLFKKDIDRHGDEEVWSRLDGRFGRREKFGNSLEIRSDLEVWEFYPDGKIDKGMIEICSEDNDCYVVSTQKYRGRVEIYEMEQE